MPESHVRRCPLRHQAPAAKAEEAAACCELWEAEKRGLAPAAKYEKEIADLKGQVKALKWVIHNYCEEGEEGEHG